MNIVAHNLLAINAQRQWGIQSKNKAKTTEKLSSGYSINRAADDAAGLSISEKLRRQIRGLRQASKNIQDGVSFVQVADGALNEVHDILQRMNELSIKAANGTNEEMDREYIQQELNQLTKECDRIFKETEFNGEKIWCAPYIPYVTGIPRELKIYNETIDARGNITMGGILWGNSKYSWNEINATMYDASTGKFMPGIYNIDVPAVEFDITDDKYVENGSIVTLEIRVSEEGNLTSISRKCDWSADENGITMDGVLYEWSDLEDLKHSKCFKTYDIEAGHWGFNTFNGTHVWFEIPEGTHSLSEVIDAINGTRLDNLNWETHLSYVKTDFAVGIQYGTHAAMFDAPTLQITNATKDLVTDKYYLHADEDGMWVENKNGTNLGKETWQQLGWENSAGVFHPLHDSTTHFYYDEPFVRVEAPDSHYNIYKGAWHYTNGAEGYNSTKIPGLDVQFTVMEEASKQGVINGIEGVVMQADIDTPSTATGIVGKTSGKVNLNCINAELSFDFHKSMGRNFDNASASLGNGTIVADTNGTILLNVRNGGNSVQFVAEEANIDIISKLKRLLEGSGGALSLNFKDTSGNTVKLDYEIASLTNAEKRDIEDGYVTLDDYINKVFSDIINSKISFKADGYAEQSLGYNRTTVSASGWANPLNTKNNKAAYANFDTKISYTRELNIQAGTEANQNIKIKYDVLNAMTLGIANISVRDDFDTKAAIQQIKKAIDIASEQRSRFGAYQNRLEHAILVDDNVAENTAAAESRIRDADMAEEILRNTLQNIVLQAGQVILAQANQSNIGIMKLLQ